MTIPTKAQVDLFAPTESVKSFEKDAMGLFKAFLETKNRQPWCAEDFTNYALLKGVVPQDLRHMGNVIRMAAADGLIRRSPDTFRRTMGHGTLTLGWVAA